MERYSINGLHKNTVTAVEWSKNGMKLFSGDQDGLVVLTEIDFYMVCIITIIENQLTQFYGHLTFCIILL